MGQTTFTGPVKSDNGFIENSFTTAQLAALPNPTIGLLVYNTTLNTYQVYNGSSFQPAFGPTPPSLIPVVNSVSPPSLSTSGGPFDIFGSNFTGVTTVTLGGLPAASFNFVNDGYIQCVSSSHPAGTVSVNVTNASGTNPPNSLLTYVAAALPVISNVDPAGGTVFGGPCNVTITGSNFTGTTNVTVDGSACSYNLINDSTITVTQLPPGPSGAVGVYVTNAGGTSTPYVWQYYQTPRVTGISPSSGSSAGGTSVTVTGYALTNMTECQFYGATETTNASGISPTNDNQATFNTPAHAAEITQLRGFNSTYGYGDYSNPIYTFTAPLPDIFTVNGAPSGTGQSGAYAYGIPSNASIFVVGSGFTGATNVYIQGSPCTFTVIDDSNLVIDSTPSLSVGSKSIQVETAAGLSNVYTGFIFTDVPVITQLVPASGPTTGGTSVGVYGYAFTTMDAFQFYGTNNVAVTPNVLADSYATLTTPAYATAEAVQVRGSNPIGGAGAFVSGLWTFTGSPPTITSTTVPGGHVSGGSSNFAISGTGFVGVTSVTFNGASASFIEASSTDIVITDFPAGSTGPANIVVTTSAGSSAPYTGWSYVDTGVITYLAPDSGPSTGGTGLVVYGYGFNSGTQMQFSIPGAANFNSFVTLVNDDQLSVTTPSSSPFAGVADVRLYTPGYGYGSFYTSAFTYLAPFTTPFSYSQGADFGAGDLFYIETSPGQFELRAIKGGWYDSNKLNNLRQEPSGFTGTLMPNNTGVTVSYTTTTPWNDGGSFWGCGVTMGGSPSGMVNIGVISG